MLDRFLSKPAPRDGSENTILMKLDDFDTRLRNTFFLQGIGLCSNIYAIGDSEITMIDTGSSLGTDRIEEFLGWSGLQFANLKQVILTHNHFDHLGGLEEILKKSKPRILAHPEDAKTLELEGSCRIRRLGDGDVIVTALGPLRVIHTPGHTSGSICLYEENVRLLFSGDTVFPDGWFGRTDMPTGNSRMMLDSLERLADLNVNILLAGHGNPLFQHAGKDIEKALNNAKISLQKYS